MTATVLETINSRRNSTPAHSATTVLETTVLETTNSAGKPGTHPQRPPLAAPQTRGKALHRLPPPPMI